MTAPVRRKLLERLTALEYQLNDRSWPRILLVPERVDPHRRENLAEGERIVLDWYLCIYPDVGFFNSRERIATDPSDLGRICQPGQCLQDVMQELGYTCRRQPDGSCPQCGPGQYPDWTEDDPSFQARLHWQPARGEPVPSTSPPELGP